MIKSKKELNEYLLQDKLALGITRTKPKLLGDEIWKFEILLRKLEYATNCKKRLLKYYYAYKYHYACIKLGVSIGLNVFDKGLAIVHLGSIVVGQAKIGKNCRIHESVCIGATNGSTKYPTIGDNCFLATGVKVIGDIQIGDNVAIGANAVVVKSFTEGNATLGGIPAKVISNNNSHAHLSLLLKQNNLL